MIEVSWTILKGFVDEKNLSIQALEMDDNYHIYAVDGTFTLSCIIPKTTPKSSDQIDYEDNYSNNINHSIHSPAAINKYSAFISVRQGATTAAGAVVWAMRNAAAATKDAYIEKIKIQMSFDTATPLARSTPRYSFIRFDTATPTGGSQISPFMFDSDSEEPQVTDIRTASGGLTVTGVVQHETFIIPGVPACDGSVMDMNVDDLAIRLKPGEGILISLLTTAVIGQYIGGTVVWSER